MVLHLLDHPRLVVRVYVLDPRFRVLVKALARPPVDLCVAGADVQHPLAFDVGHPEDLVNVLHQLTKAFLGFAHRLLGAASLEGHQVVTHPVQRFAHCADDRSHEHEENQGSHVVCIRDVKRRPLLCEEVVCNDGAENRCRDPGPEAAEVCGNHYGREKRHLRDGVPQHWIDQQADEKRERSGRKGDAIGRQRVARSFVHPNL